MTKWPSVPLSEVLQLQRRWVEVNPTDDYTEIGVRSFGNGIFHKPPRAGQSLGDKRVLAIQPGDLVFNNVFAWEGAVALAGPTEAGTIGSHRFVTLTADVSRCSTQFYRCFFTSQGGLDILRRVSPGSAGRNRTLNLAEFQQQPVPVPPLAEQRRIVDRVEAVATRLAEARRLREETQSEAKSALSAALNELLARVEVCGTLGDILRSSPRNGWSARCDGLDTGTPILGLGAVTGYRYRSADHKWTSEPTNPDAHYWLRPDDLLITRSNTPELVGHAAIYDGSPKPCIYPDLMMRLDPDPTRTDKRFVLLFLQSRAARDHIERHAKGTNPTMKKISQGVVTAIPFPTNLSLAEQLRIVAQAEALQAKLDAVRALQSETAVELDALLPSVLNKAFAGEL